MSAPLLSVRNLQTHFFTDAGVVRAVDGVSFDLAPGEALGVVGESGSGKSVTSLSIMRLVAPPGRIIGGEIWFEGANLLQKSEAEMQALRGNRISIVFQEPASSLNPVYAVGEQIAEVIRWHEGESRRAARLKATDLLRLVGIPSPEQRVDTYPHQMSGGMRQRVMIAMALACQPRLLIADEPTTALDVTIQAQILDLLRRLQQELGMAIILITHSLGVIAELVRRVVVLYAGKVVEEADVEALFAAPQHPYTVGLLSSLPKVSGGRERLTAIEGAVPDPLALPSGCRFHPRCPWRQSVCEREEPPLLAVGAAHGSRCWRHTDFRVTTSVPPGAQAAGGP